MKNTGRENEAAEEPVDKAGRPDSIIIIKNMQEGSRCCQYCCGCDSACGGTCDGNPADSCRGEIDCREI